LSRKSGDYSARAPCFSRLTEKENEVKKGRKIVVVAAVVTVAILALSFLVNNSFFGESFFGPRHSDHDNFISISLIMDEGTIRYFDELYSWLPSLNYTRFTFVVENTTEDFILNNQSRLDLLKQYGRLIPRLDYYQLLTNEERSNFMNETINEYRDKLGYLPTVFMDFMPDTFTANELLDIGVQGYQGYCFDQYAIDHITERGGFQMPYYASSANILVPSTGRGVVVLPHATWDWVASFTVNHNLQAHVPNLMGIFNAPGRAKDYFFKFLNGTLAGSSPFGFFSFQFEWSLVMSYGYENIAKDWINTIMNNYKEPTFRLVTYEEFVQWFTHKYSTNPEYRINFTSPYNNQTIEWYFSNEKRVARISDSVVSYVDYTKQLPDKYLNQNGWFDWNKSGFDPSNCLDDSLSFGVDALGGGLYRAPVSTSPVPYTGNLKSFQH
jgi:hypothetical protein